MTENGSGRSVLSQLDADELLAMRENLQAAAQLDYGPPGRRVPVSLCIEMEKVLQLMALETRR